MSRLSSGLPGTIAGPESPPLAEPLAAVETQPAPQLLGGAGVALAALRGEDGPDLRLEELLLLGRDRRPGDAAAPVGFSFGASGFAVAPPGLCGNDLRYSASERKPSRSASSRWNIGSIVAAAFFMRGELRRKSRYSSSERRPSRSASPSMKIRSGSKGGNRGGWACFCSRPASASAQCLHRGRQKQDDHRDDSRRESRHQRTPLSIEQG